MKFRLPLGMIWVVFSPGRLLGRPLSTQVDFEGPAPSHSGLHASLTVLSVFHLTRKLPVSRCGNSKKSNLPSMAFAERPRQNRRAVWPWHPTFHSGPHGASWTLTLSFLRIGDTHICTGNTWYSHFAKWLADKGPLYLKWIRMGVYGLCWQM